MIKALHTLQSQQSNLIHQRRQHFKKFIEAGAQAPKSSNRASLIIIGSINLGAMLNHALCITAITAFLFLLPAQTRLYADGFGVQIFRRQGCWVFVDRLHLDPGHMSVNARLKLHLPTPKHNAQYKLQLVAIPESIWQRAVQSKCNIHSLTPPQQEEKRQKEVVFEFELTPNNGYATRVVSQLEVPAEQSYNFVLRDCSRVLVDDGYGRQSKIELTLDMRNNESHLSSGEHSYGWLLPLLLLVGAGTLWLLRREKEEQGDNWIKLAVKMSMAVGLGSILFKYLGYLVYAHGRGVEHGFFEVVYLLLQATSDSILMVLLMVLSFGWTVTFKKAQDFGLYVPLACMLGLVNILMTMLNKISDGQHDKYHMYDSIPAYIMIAFRLVGLVVVVVGLARTWLTLPILDGPGGHKLSSYFWQLAALALLYMAFVPIGFLGVGFLGSRHRKEAMFFAMELARFALSAWLAWLAGCKKSAYRAILDQSFMEKAEKFY